MPLAKFPKPNYLRVRVSLHKKKHSREVALSYTDIWKNTHRTPWCKTRHQAEGNLICMFTRLTGVGRVSLIVTEEILEPSKHEHTPSNPSNEQVDWQSANQAR